MDELIRSLGRLPVQRTTLYGMPPAAQTARSYAAAPLVEIATVAPPRRVAAVG
jgi:FO synthase